MIKILCISAFLNLQYFSFKISKGRGIEVIRITIKFIKEASQVPIFVFTTRALYGIFIEELIKVNIISVKGTKHYKIFNKYNVLTHCKLSSLLIF